MMGKTVTLLHNIKQNYDHAVPVPTEDSYTIDGAAQKCQYVIRKLEGLTRRLASLAEPAKGREILFERSSTPSMAARSRSIFKPCKSRETAVA